MKVGIIGILFDNVACLIVFSLADRISGGFRFLLLLSAFCQGLCGGRLFILNDLHKCLY